MKSILQKILAVLARATLRKYRPIIIGITGSVGKTSTREAIATVLKRRYRLRQPQKNYNNEIGLPLTILGMPHYGRSILQWVGGLTRVAVRLFLRPRRYPEVLVLEYGVDRPRDMEYLLSIAKPAIAMVTAIGDIPVHVEFFKDPTELAAEKAKLVAALPPEGYAILNHDDYAVYDMKEETKAKVMSFGVEEHAEVRITGYEFLLAKEEGLGDVPRGIAFRLEYGGKNVPVYLHDTFGMPHAYAAAAAAAVGLVMHLNLAEAAEALKSYIPPPGRLRLLRGIKHSFILDDTYNASPESMRSALDTLRALPGKRKIAVLGDMLEIGRYTEQAHRAIGDIAAEFVDLLFTVGPRAKFIADEAMTRGLERRARTLSSGEVFAFGDAVAAGRVLDPIVREGDLILVKGSQAMRMEKAVEEIMAHPEQARDLLVRQDVDWKRFP